MTITRIEKKNQAYFAPFFLEEEGRYGGNILRIGAIENGTACAAAAFELSGTTAELTSIFVVPACRRRGLGRALLDTFAELAAGTEVTSLTANFIPEPRDGLQAFFTSLGFELFGGSQSFTVPYEAAKNADGLKKFLENADCSGTVLSFEELSDAQTRELDAQLRTFNTTLAEITTGNFSRELSFAFYKNGSFNAAIFCSLVGKQLGIDFLLTRDSAAGPTLAMAKKLAERLAAREEPPAQIAFLAANPAVPAIAGRLFGSAVQPDKAAVYALKFL